MDREVKSFAERLQGEVLDTAASEDSENSAALLTFKENAFTHVFISYLIEAGVLKGDVCFLQRKQSAGHVKVNGFGVGDDDCLDLLVTIYQSHNGQGPERISKTELQDALASVHQVLHFCHFRTTLTWSLRAIHTQWSGGSTTCGIAFLASGSTF